MTKCVSKTNRLPLSNIFFFFRKKLRSEIQKSFPSLTATDVTDIIPSKDEVTTVKIYTSVGDNAFIYCVNKQPVLFELDKGKVLYPTGMFGNV